MVGEGGARAGYVCGRPARWAVHMKRFKTPIKCCAYHRRALKRRYAGDVVSWNRLTGQVDYFI